MATSKPSIVLLCGMWHHAVHYQGLKMSLEQAGYEVSVAENISQTDLTACVTDDALHFRNQTLLPMIEQDKDIVVLLHSYAGVPGSSAVRGLSKTERMAKGENGGIVGLLYMTAAMIPEGVCHMEAGVGRLVPGADVDETTGNVTVKKATAREFLYHQSSEELASKATSELRPQNIILWTTPAGPLGVNDPGFDGRRAYLLCTDDHTLPPQIQRDFIGVSGKSDWKVKDLHSDHSPFMSHLDETKEWIIGETKAFMATY